MRNFFLVAIIISIAITFVFTGCESVSSKENAARLSAIESEKDMLALLKANADIRITDRNIFQNMAEINIRRNDLDLAALKEKIKLSNKDEQTAYEIKIELLEQKNKELKIRKEASVQSLNDWDLFKQEYNADIDKLRGTLKDLAQEGKK